MEHAANEDVCFPALLTVDNTVVDLETIEALYENVSYLCTCSYIMLTSFMERVDLNQVNLQ